MKARCIAFGAVVAVTVALGSVAASGEAPPKTTFAVVLDAASEVPHCAPATNAARGLAILHVTDEAAGTVDYKVVANNLPGDITAAHIHLAPVGVAGPVVQPLVLTPGDHGGVVGEGSFTNHALVVAMQAQPESYYINVHSTVCPTGVIRGQLG